MGLGGVDFFFFLLATSKKLKQPFDFSKETMDKVIQTVAGDTFGILNPNTVFSFINAIYYFPEYLSACK